MTSTIEDLPSGTPEHEEPHKPRRLARKVTAGFAVLFLTTQVLVPLWKAWGGRDTSDSDLHVLLARNGTVWVRVPGNAQGRTVHDYGLVAVVEMGGAQLSYEQISPYYDCAKTNGELWNPLRYRLVLNGLHLNLARPSDLHDCVLNGDIHVTPDGVYR